MHTNYCKCHECGLWSQNYIYHRNCKWLLSKAAAKWRLSPVCVNRTAEGSFVKVKWLQHKQSWIWVFPHKVCISPSPFPGLPSSTSSPVSNTLRLWGFGNGVEVWCLFGVVSHSILRLRPWPAGLFHLGTSGCCPLVISSPFTYPFRSLLWQDASNAKQRWQAWQLPYGRLLWYWDHRSNQVALFIYLNVLGTRWRAMSQTATQSCNH